MKHPETALTDRYIARLPPADAGERYMVRDAELRGFFLMVGPRRKTFMIQGECWKNGRRKSVKMAIGHADEITSREARAEAKSRLVAIARGEVEEALPDASKPKIAEVTLRQAWDRYREAHMERKERSEATIRGYRDHVERLLKAWLDTSLRELGENPRLVADRHDEITRRHGKCAANGAMRTLRAIYNHARRTSRELPPDNPTMGVDWNLETRRNTAMGLEDLPRWFREAGDLRHPVRREFHLFTLLSGSRPAALMQAKVEHLDLRRRVLHIPRPKGGAKRAFDIPLSRPMICCLIRAMRAGRQMHWDDARAYLFPADSVLGHMAEHKEPRTRLFKWGNDLRQSYRTLGQAAGLSDIDMHLLMNHSLPGVNAGYITRAKLLSDHLRGAQERLSAFVIAHGKPKNDVMEKRSWPNLPSRRIGNPRLDPVEPDPRARKGAALTEAAEKRGAAT